MTKLPIGLQVYSVRDFAEKDFRATMEQVKAMGYDGVELAGLYGRPAAQIKDVLDEVGLQLVSAHVPVKDLLLDEVLDDYASIGLKYIVIPSRRLEENTENCLMEAIEEMKGIALRCNARGMKLLYHNHDFEFVKTNGSYNLDIIYRELPPEQLETELDTCWVHVGGEDPADYVRKYAGRVPVVHLKDFVGNKSEHMYELIGDESTKQAQMAFEFRPVGYGRQDMPAIIRAAEESGASWLVVEQDRPSMEKNSMECAQMSIAYLRSLK